MSVISLLCALLAFVAALVSANESKECSTLNSFIPLMTGDVKIFERVTPVAATEKHGCASEWTAHGTCCEYDSLKKYAIKDRTEFLGLMQQLNASMIETTAIYQKYFSLMSFMGTTVLWQLGLQPYVNFYQYFVNYTFQAQNASQKAMLDYIHVGIITNYIFGPNSINKTSVCMLLMSNARANSLCSVCSGRSNETFFDNTTQKAKLGTPHCKIIVDACAPMFHGIAMFSKAASFLANLSRIVGYEKFMDQKDLKGGQGFMKTDAFINSNTLNLALRLNAYMREPETSPNKLPLAKYLCQVLLRLRMKPFLEGFILVHKNLNKYLNAYIETALSVTPKWMMEKPNWRAARRRLRLLQEELNAISYLPGDLVVVDQAFNSTFSNLQDDNATVIKMSLYNNSFFA